MNKLQKRKTCADIYPSSQKREVEESCQQITTPPTKTFSQYNKVVNRRTCLLNLNDYYRSYIELQVALHVGMYIFVFLLYYPYST